MSVKFEKDSVKTTVKAAATEVGTALTGGKTANGYLAVCCTTSATKVAISWRFALYTLN